MLRRYRLHHVIGQGGMGVVYRATDRLTGDVVALKQVTFSPSSTFSTHIMNTTQETSRLALAREFQTLASLRHPNIISVLDYGFDDRQLPYFTMSYIESPRTIYDAGNRLNIIDKVHLIQQMLSALVYLHRRGILHCDLKPDNVLLQGDIVKVLDFGLAAAKGVREVTSGTLFYMAPEVFQGNTLTEATDLYAAGIIAFELFAGRHPFNTQTGYVMQLLTKQPDLSLLHVPKALQQVVGKLLRTNPEERFASAQAAIDAFARAIGEVMPSESVAIRESFLQAAQFVGRDEERAQLLQAMTDAQARQGSTWLIGGESGVGKSRLINELRTQAMVKGGLVLRGRGVEGGGGVPNQLWQDVIRRLVLSTNLNHFALGVLKSIVPDIEQLVGHSVPDVPALDEQAAQQRLWHTLIDLFEQQEQWIFLVLEDLHWVYESLTFLKELNRAITHLPVPVVVVGTYRNEERPDLPAELPRMQVMTLSRFSDEEMVALSTAMLGNAGKDPDVLHLLQRETEGNVFFLIEVIRALAEEAGRLEAIGRMVLPATLFPQGIQTIVERRLAPLPAPVRHLLAGAAIAGRKINLRLLEQLAHNLDIPLDMETWLTTCARTQVLEIQDEGWLFSHDKLREGILASLLPDEKKQWHQEVAHTLEQTYPDDKSHAAALAYHWRMVGNASKEYLYTRQAGEYAASHFANTDALAFFNRALELVDEQQQQDRYQLVSARETLYELQGERDLQAQDIETLKELAEHLGDAEKAMTALQQAKYYSLIGDFQQAMTYAQKTIDLAEQVPDPSLMAKGHGVLGTAYIQLSQYEQAREHHNTSFRLAKELDQRQLQVQSLRGLATVAWRLGEVEARAYLEEGLALLETLGDTEEEGIFYGRLGTVLVQQGKYAQALRAFQKALSIQQEIGGKHGEADICNNLGDIFRLMGDYEQSKKYFEQGLAIARELGGRGYECMILYNLGLVLSQTHENEQALARLQEAYALSQEIGFKRVEGYISTVWGHIYTEQKKFDEAQQAYEQAIAIWQEIGIEHLVIEAKAGLANLYLGQKQTESALAIVESILPYLENNTLDGTEEPFRVYYTCYQVLYAMDDEREVPFLMKAYQLLQEVAAKIEEEQYRQAFLEDIFYHWQLGRVYQYVTRKPALAE